MFTLEGHRRLRVISACSSRWSQFLIGDYGSVEHKPAMKLSLGVLISHSDVFRLCMPVGESCKSMYLDIFFV